MQEIRRRIVWLYPKLTTWMGGVRYVYEALSEFSKRHDTILVVQRAEPEIIRDFEKAGIQVISLDLPSFTEILFWLRFKSVIRKAADSLRPLLEDRDVLIHSYFPMNCVASVLQRHSIQIVYEPFALFFDENYRKSHGVPIRVFSRLVSFLHAKDDIQATRSSQALLSLSEFERRNTRKVYDKDSGVTFEGVNLGHFRPSVNNELRSKYAGKKIIFHSTGYDSYKGTDLVIRAIPWLAQKRSDFQVLISHTRVNEKKLAQYRAFLEASRCVEYVEFLGFLDFQYMPSYYTLAEVYVEPGKNRSMSFSSKEANACGTPSIRGSLGAEDTVDGVTGLLVDPDDEKELAEKILTILDDSELRNRLGKAAKEEIEKKYTWERVCQRIEEKFQVLPR